MVVNTYLFILLAIRNLASGGSHFHQQKQGLSMRWKGQGGKKKLKKFISMAPISFMRLMLFDCKMDRKQMLSR